MRFRLAFLVLISTSTLFLSCAEVKQAGRDVGHATRDATREIGHATRDATKAVGHGTRDAVKEVGKETKRVINGEE